MTDIPKNQEIHGAPGGASIATDPPEAAALIAQQGEEVFQALQAAILAVKASPDNLYGEHEKSIAHLLLGYIEKRLRE